MERPKVAVVTGGSSGLGWAIADDLSYRYRYQVWAISQDGGCPDESIPMIADVRTEEGARKVAHDAPDRVDFLINCAGINHIDYLEHLEESDWDAVVDTNAKGIYLMTRALLPALIAAKGTVVNIVSNAAHIPMTGSLAYNASKGAAHIMTLQLARELTPRYGITVFGIAPNKMEKTAMSDYIDRTVPIQRGWTPEEAAAYQRKSLLCGKETPPVAVAEFLGFLLSSHERHQYLTGCVLPYGA